jgi:hypothetical protein
MSTRNGARRHRGQNRMRPRPTSAVLEPPELHPAENPHDAIAWWRERLDKPQFVYFIQEPDGGPVKIGEAFDPAGRLRELQCGNPRQLELRAVVLASDQTERRLHIAWAHVCIRGEWFTSDEIVRLARVAQRQQVEAVGRVGAFEIASMVAWLVGPADQGTWAR